MLLELAAAKQTLVRGKRMGGRDDGGASASSLAWELQLLAGHPGAGV